jgi:hypothetical protein
MRRVERPPWTWTWTPALSAPAPVSGKRAEATPEDQALHKSERALFVFRRGVKLAAIGMIIQKTQKHTQNN